MRRPASVRASRLLRLALSAATFLMGGFGASSDGLLAGDELPPWVLYRLEGREPFDYFGIAFVALGDVSGDGWPDFAVRAREPGDAIRGRVEIRSGPDGAVLHEITSGLEKSAGYGRSMATGGDLDGDGVPDLLLQGNLFIDAVSCRTGERIWRREHWKYGFHLLGLVILPDVDGDGHDDYIIGNEEEYKSPTDLGLPDQHGRVTLHSGRTHDVLWDIRGEREDDHFGSWVVDVGDINGDGVHDLAISAPRRLLQFEDTSKDPEFVYFVSGASGEELWRFSLGIPAAGLVGAMPLGDADADGITDFIVDAWNAPIHDRAGAGWVVAVSGRTHGVLWTTTGQDFDHVPFDTAFFGDRLAALAVVDDLDGDEVPDVVANAQRSLFAGADDSKLHILSGRDGSTLGVIEAELRSTLFGSTADRLGDVDGDGLPEFLIGTPEWDGRGEGWPSNIGTVHVVSFLPDSEPFIRGDTDLDGRIWLTDAAFILRHLFQGGEAPCLDAMDQNRDRLVGITDAIIILQHLFRAGAAPKAPFPTCAHLFTFSERLPCERSGCE